MSEHQEQQVRQLRQQEERARRRLQLIDDMHKGTPRARRARRFADMVHVMLRDFLPQDRDCRRRINDYLIEIGFENNAEIISVPPECDELDKLALERRMLETKIASVGSVGPDLLGKPA